MLYTRLDKYDNLESFNISYLYDNLKEIAENKECIEIGMNPAGEIFIYVEASNKYLEYVVSGNEYCVSLVNKLSDETLSVALAPDDEIHVAREFMYEVYRVSGV